MTERHNRLQAGNQFYHQGALDDGTSPTPHRSMRARSA